MAASIRISDELYELAQAEARVMSRSLAQQLEHWARLGFAMEKSGQLNHDDIRAAAMAFRHAVNAADVAAGRRTAESLHLIPARVARRSKVTFPKDAFDDGRKGW